MAAVYFSLDSAGYKYSFRILSKRNVPDHESQESGFDPLNPSSEWIQRIQNPFGNSGKETQNPFWDPDSDSPKETYPKMYFLETMTKLSKTSWLILDWITFISDIICWTINHNLQSANLLSDNL